MEMKGALEKERAHLVNEIRQTGAFPEYGRNDEDNATEVADFTAASSTADALKQRLIDVQAALLRITAGTYGITDTGRVIPEDRLRANPAATTIVT